VIYMAVYMGVLNFFPGENGKVFFINYPKAHCQKTNLNFWKWASLGPVLFVMILKCKRKTKHLFYFLFLAMKRLFAKVLVNKIMRNEINYMESISDI